MKSDEMCHSILLDRNDNIMCYLTRKVSFLYFVELLLLSAGGPKPVYTFDPNSFGSNQIGGMGTFHGEGPSTSLGFGLSGPNSFWSSFSSASPRKVIRHNTYGPNFQKMWYQTSGTFPNPSPSGSRLQLARSRKVQKTPSGVPTATENYSESDENDPWYDAIVASAGKGMGGYNPPPSFGPSNEVYPTETSLEYNEPITSYDFQNQFSTSPYQSLLGLNQQSSEFPQSSETMNDFNVYDYHMFHKPMTQNSYLSYFSNRHRPNYRAQQKGVHNFGYKFSNDHQISGFQRTPAHPYKIQEQNLTTMSDDSSLYGIHPGYETLGVSSNPSGNSGFTQNYKIQLDRQTPNNMMAWLQSHNNGNAQSIVGLPKSGAYRFKQKNNDPCSANISFDTHEDGNNVDKTRNLFHRYSYQRKSFPMSFARTSSAARWKPKSVRVQPAHYGYSSGFMRKPFAHSQFNYGLGLAPNQFSVDNHNKTFPSLYTDSHQQRQSLKLIIPLKHEDAPAADEFNLRSGEVVSNPVVGADKKGSLLTNHRKPMGHSSYASATAYGHSSSGVRRKPNSGVVQNLNLAGTHSSNHNVGWHGHLRESKRKKPMSFANAHAKTGTMNSLLHSSSRKHQAAGANENRRSSLLYKSTKHKGKKMGHSDYASGKPHSHLSTGIRRKSHSGGILNLSLAGIHSSKHNVGRHGHSRGFQKKITMSLTNGHSKEGTMNSLPHSSKKHQAAGAHNSRKISLKHKSTKHKGRKMGHSSYASGVRRKPHSGGVRNLNLAGTHSSKHNVRWHGHSKGSRRKKTMSFVNAHPKTGTMHSLLHSSPKKHQVADAHGNGKVVLFHKSTKHKGRKMGHSDYVLEKTPSSLSTGIRRKSHSGGVLNLNLVGAHSSKHNVGRYGHSREFKRKETMSGSHKNRKVWLLHKSTKHKGRKMGHSGYASGKPHSHFSTGVRRKSHSGGALDLNLPEKHSSKHNVGWHGHSRGSKRKKTIYFENVHGKAGTMHSLIHFSKKHQAAGAHKSRKVSLLHKSTKHTGRKMGHSSYASGVRRKPHSGGVQNLNFAGTHLSKHNVRWHDHSKGSKRKKTMSFVNAHSKTGTIHSLLHSSSRKHQTVDADGNKKVLLLHKSTKHKGRKMGHLGYALGKTHSSLSTGERRKSDSGGVLNLNLTRTHSSKHNVGRHGHSKGSKWKKTMSFVNAHPKTGTMHSLLHSSSKKHQVVGAHGKRKISLYIKAPKTREEKWDISGYASGKTLSRLSTGERRKSNSGGVLNLNLAGTPSSNHNVGWHGHSRESKEKKTMFFANGHTKQRTMTSLLHSSSKKHPALGAHRNRKVALLYKSTKHKGRKIGHSGHASGKASSGVRWKPNSGGVLNLNLAEEHSQDHAYAGRKMRHSSYASAKASSHDENKESVMSPKCTSQHTMLK